MSVSVEFQNRVFRSFQHIRGCFTLGGYSHDVVALIINDDDDNGVLPNTERFQDDKVQMQMFTDVASGFRLRGWYAWCFYFPFRTDVVRSGNLAQLGDFEQKLIHPKP